MILCLMILSATSNKENNMQKVSYVTTKSNEEFLRKKAKEVKFPLDQQTKEDIKKLQTVYKNSEKLVGLSAPQIGISRRIIVFQVKDSEETKKFRKDLTDTMSLTLWINPTFEPVGNKTSEDWEGCASVPDKAGLVSRFSHIKYKAQDQNGNSISGEAKGFLARVIQHEIDHLNGILFIDKTKKLMSKEEYFQMRKKAYES